MKNLLWVDGYGWTTNDAGTVFPLATKPAFSFTYDALYHEPGNDFYVSGGVRTELSPDQITEVENFIASVPQTTPQAVMAVDSRGKYLGLVAPTDPSFYKQVDGAPYNSSNMRFDFNSNSWLIIQAVDQNGNFLGNVSLDDLRYYKDVQSIPPYPYSVWDFTANGWKDGRTLSQLKTDLCNAIDVLADQVCLMYVTGGETQGARYQRKLAQAQAYKAAGYPYSAYPAQIDTVAYSYIAAETTKKNARDATVTGQSVADMVINQAAAWDGKGGEIEGTRTAGKDAINAATDAAGAQSTYDTVVSELKSLAP